MSTESLKKMIEKLRPLHEKLGKPQPGDWLAEHHEPGQTFQEYLQCKPVTPRGKRRVIYIQPLGKFTKTQRRVVDLTADFMGLYFNLPVKINDDLPLSIIPERARRIHPYWRMKQILSTYVLDAVLIPRLPKDAAAYIAFTASDLWPGMGWNFVFGQASTRDRVGVWSIYRNGDPAESGAAFQLCLLRTMKTAVHETGHMFSLLHCTLYQCCICGSNHREESDQRPITLCPECLAKLCWATRIDPIERYKKLVQFFEKNSFNKEAQFCKKSILSAARTP
jgi:archaemetzincin